MISARWALVAVLLAAVAPTLVLGEAIKPAVLRGTVKQELVLDETLLKSLPSVNVDVSFDTSEGEKFGSYIGVLLWTLVERAETIDVVGKNARLQHTLLI